MNFTFPGVYPSEVNASQYIPARNTSIFGVVGVFEKGALDTPILVTSLEDARAQLGTYLDGHQGLFALKAFFENGGGRAYAVRTCKHTAGVASALNAVAALDDRHATAPVPTLTVSAASPGVWGNALSVEIADSAAYPATGFNVLVYETVGGVAILRETFADVLIGPANIASDDFVEKRINGISAYVTVSAVTQGVPTAAPADRPAVATTVLASGDDGLTGIALLDYTDALAALDTVAVNYIAIPGEADAVGFQALSQALITYVEGRKNCFAILEMVQDESAAASVTTRANASVNSTYGAFYGPHLDIVHPISGRDVAVGPAGYAAGVYARTNTQVGVWGAPAGTQRGVLLNVKRARQTYSPGQKEVLYEAQINAILVEQGAVTIMGQKTATVKASKVDRINVRLLMIDTAVAVKNALQEFVFQPNNVGTWSELKRVLDPFFRERTDAGAFVDYNIRVVTDAVLLQQNILKTIIRVIPTGTAEFLPVEFGIDGDTVSYAELF